VVGTSILGVFNISSRPLTEIFPLMSFRGVTPGESYIIRSHNSNKVIGPLTTKLLSSHVVASLGVRGYDILCAYPLWNGPRNSSYFANLGLVRKMTGCAAINNTSFEVQENGRVLMVTSLRGLGVLGRCHVISYDLYCRQNKNTTRADE
jgi:hypothetical protein